MAKYISINVDIDLDDALAEIKTDDLAEELASRDVSGHREAVTTAIAQIRRGDTLDAITTLEREFWPKWTSVQDSEAALRAANDNQEAAPKSAAG
jgi:hypothetical protein